MSLNIEPVLQLLFSEKLIYFYGRNYNLSDEDLNNIIQKIPSLWWNDNDKVIFFTYYNDGSYFCERKKQVYDYKNKITTDKIYQFIEPSFEDAKEWYLILVDSLEEIRVRQLQNAKEDVRQKVLEEGKVLKITLETYRNSLLKQSDWTQLSDVPLSEEAKNLWKKYRQYLRDITSDFNWTANDFFLVDFPKTPYEYVDLYPNRDVEYLSTPDQFNNYGANTVKLKLARVLDYLASPSIISENDTSALAGEDLQKLYNTPYKDFMEKVNKYLSRIDPSLTFEIQIVDNPCPPPVTEVKPNPQLP